ncbi:putative receptor-interacting serine/threonine-protein kinase 1-like [Apostichopus japonicus]|uniref:Putative receptor-interacting serine/threonine-protein kinase 1-like n=1 Tax=Stichopus japonicus TaxID=307972 RepID=A0A2G8JVQ5_STIJA|nr:putative receptor-interacting serine/threonine-protein kinase 1-like [Apostichopus japonicus]
MELGYYIDLPGKKGIIEKNNLKVLQEKPFAFLREGRLPLKILLENICPKSWKYNQETNPKEIPFMQVELNIEFSCPFVFEKVGEEDCIFHFQATQKEKIELIVKNKEVLAASQSGSSAQLVDVQSSKERRFNESTPTDTDTSMVRLAAPHSDSVSPSLTRDVQLSQQQRSNESSKVTYGALRDGGEDSAASSSNKVLDAGLSQSQKRTYDESLTVKQPLENIDLEVITESLRHIYLQDISAASLSGNPAPSQSADVPHSKKRRFNESTAVVMAGVEDSAASSSNKVVDAGLSQSQQKTGDGSLTVKQPMENIDLEVRTGCLRDLSGKIPKEWKNIGRNLGLKDPELCILERDNNNQGHKETVYQMLRTWKQSHGSKATYRVLGEALGAAGRRDLQEMLYKQGKYLMLYLKGT